MAKSQRNRAKPVTGDQLKVFVSWSGARSQGLAEALKDWLQYVFDDVLPWMSSHDIGAGSRWGTDIALELDNTDFGILCLTPENLSAPWVLFEAGSLAKSVEHGRVVPYRLQLAATDVAPPIGQFQGVDADEKGTYKLICDINAVRKSQTPESKLRVLFDALWPKLADQIGRIPPAKVSGTPVRPDRALLEEVLELARAQKIRGDIGVERSPNQQKLESAIENIFGMKSDKLLEHYAVLKTALLTAPNKLEEFYLRSVASAAGAELKRRSMHPESVGTNDRNEPGRE